MSVLEKKKKCFPSISKVKLESGKIVTMSELQIGDNVQTGLVSVLFSYTKSDIKILDFKKDKN